MLIFKELLDIFGSLYLLAANIHYCDEVLPTIESLRNDTAQVQELWSSTVTVRLGIEKALAEAVNVSDPRDLELTYLQTTINISHNAFSTLNEAMDDLRLSVYILESSLDDIRQTIDKALTDAAGNTLLEVCKGVLIKIARHYRLGKIPDDIHCGGGNPLPVYGRRRSGQTYHQLSLINTNPNGEYLDLLDTPFDTMVRKLLDNNVLKVEREYWHHQRHPEHRYIKLTPSPANQQVHIPPLTKQLRSSLDKENEIFLYRESMNQLMTTVRNVRNLSFTAVQNQTEDILKHIEHLRDAVSASKDTGEAYIILYAATVQQDDKTNERFHHLVHRVKKSWNNIKTAVNKLMEY